MAKTVIMEDVTDEELDEDFLNEDWDKPQEEEEPVEKAKHKPMLKHFPEEIARIKELAALTNKQTLPGYCPFAYALIPDGTGNYVAVELRKVSFVDAGPPEKHSAARLQAEPRKYALARLVAGATKRSSDSDHSGWLTATERRKRGLK